MERFGNEFRSGIRTLGLGLGLGLDIFFEQLVRLRARTKDRVIDYEY